MSDRDRDPRAVPRVAIIARQGKFLVAEPFFGAGPRLAVSRDKRYDVGDLVELSGGATSGPPDPDSGSGGLGPRSGGSRSGSGGSGGSGSGRKGGSRRPKVLRRLGRPDIARDVILALMLDRGLDGRFDPAVGRSARDASEREVQTAGRRDLRDLPTFTIDPVTARDFDDAISAEPTTDGGWRVWVHIADVSFYVPQRSLVDREAYRRATSVYVPGSVEPMLPQSLSNGACSLVPDELRPTLTVELTIGTRGVRGASIYRSLIRSDARLDYDRVDRIFAGSETAAAPWGGPLDAARAAAAALDALRRHRSAVVLQSAEPDFRFDRRGDVIAGEPTVQTESHRLIEHLMIAANEQVAQFLEERKIPALYRVHERPESAAVDRLIEQLASLGVPTPPVPDGHLSATQAAEVVSEASELVAAWVARTGHGGRALNSLVLRSLKQAYYSDRNLGHAGLASASYCHFTSPIRRYPDLICHRAVLSAVAGEPVPDATWVHAAGPWTSTRERRAMTIERDADDIARCFLLAGLLGVGGSGGGANGTRGGTIARTEDRSFEGEVVGLIGAGAFVAFGPAGEYQGLLPVRRLRGDWWELNDEGTILVGTRNGGSIRLGDPITVRVARIDAPRGRVDLLPADDTAD